MSLPADTVLMVRPRHFGFNEETAESNAFQQAPGGEVQETALQEFEHAVQVLEAVGIRVIVIDDRETPRCPDAVFPNNWFSTHADGRLVTYPMATPSRRAERREDLLDLLQAEFGYSRRLRMEDRERETPPRVLEGTGSLVLDAANRIAYAAISPRCHPDAVLEWSVLMDYKPHMFRASGPDGQPIYHTNVMLCIGDSFAVAGLECVHPEDGPRLRAQLAQSGKTLVELSNEQVFRHFAGNMLQLRNAAGETVLVMSESADDSLTAAQRKALSDRNGMLLSIPVPTIERVGGGSIRCMMAEIFTPSL